MEPECGKCGDSLWVLTQSTGEDASGIATPCDCQSDQEGRRDRLRTYAQLGFLERMEFGGLRKNHRSVKDGESFLKSKHAARDFADEPKGWLVFEGASGSGKTHFVAAIVNALIRRGQPVKYVTALDLPDLIRSGWSQGIEDFESDAFDPLLNAPVLAIDDFGIQPSIEWVEAKIDQLLTLRFNRRAPTILALAKPLADLPERHATKLNDPRLTRLINLTKIESNRAGLPAEMLEKMSFENFKTEGAPGATQNQRYVLKVALGISKDFVENPEKSKPWLYLQGDTGVGKTHLLFAIAGASINKGLEVCYWSLPRFMDRLRQTFSTPIETDFFALFDTARDAELLLLDDFGMQHMTDWSLEKSYQLLAYRHDRGLRTVVAGQYKIWDPTDDGSERHPSTHSHPTNQWTDIIRTDPPSDVESPHLLKRQWRSITSRIGDQRTVTVINLSAPDYRNRGA